MKRLLSVIFIASISVVLFSSCGKRCYCSRFENGNKVVTYENDRGSRFFNKDACTNQSVATYQGFSMANDNPVDVEIRCK